ncbi:MAG: hypothetical protein Q4B52_03790 [Tissierellia bacterium]|nr:hypothetical protein [Tissierellia bacterium]
MKNQNSINLNLNNLIPISAIKSENLKQYQNWLNLDNKTQLDKFLNLDETAQMALLKTMTNTISSLSKSNMNLQSKVKEFSDIQSRINTGHGLQHRGINQLIDTIYQKVEILEPTNYDIKNKKELKKKNKKYTKLTQHEMKQICVLLGLRKIKEISISVSTEKGEQIRTYKDYPLTDFSLENSYIIPNPEYDPDDKATRTKISEFHDISKIITLLNKKVMDVLNDNFNLESPNGLNVFLNHQFISKDIELLKKLNQALSDIDYTYSYLKDREIDDIEKVINSYELKQALAILIVLEYGFSSSFQQEFEPVITKWYKYLSVSK